MTSPLAILCYEKLLPGSQMVTRLEDLAYRVEVLNDSSRLVAVAEQSKPMVVLVDMASERHDVASAITSLRAGEDTSHIPILAFTAKDDDRSQETARVAGANLVASEEAILNQLPSLLDHVLEI